LKLRLHIDRVVIDAGALQGERPAAVRAALERELARLFESSVDPAQFKTGGATPSLPAIALPAPKGRESFSARVASAVHSRITSRDNNHANPRPEKA
jgi:hypothetical protein